MAETVDLDEIDPDVVTKAFWLQEKIQREGLDGIHYSFRGKKYAEHEGPDIVADEITKSLKGFL